MSDFHNYDIFDLAHSPNGVYGLADGLLPEMAEATGYDLEATPTTEAIQGFIRHIGPAKTLQDNIGLVQEHLATNSDAVTIASNWAERSGSLQEMHGGFADPEIPYPSSLKVAVFNTAVGRWQERRAKKVLELVERGVDIRHVAIFAGNRAMTEVEHPEVSEIAKRDGDLPTEARFAELYTAEMLRSAGVDTNVISVDSSVGDEIFKEGLTLNEWLFNYQVLAVGNAPSTVQVAGQYRKAARSIESWDNSGRQLFMAGDSIPVARHGEGPATHQNPFTALGQIARNALILHEQSQSQPFTQ